MTCSYNQESGCNFKLAEGREFKSHPAHIFEHSSFQVSFSLLFILLVSLCLSTSLFSVAFPLQKVCQYLFHPLSLLCLVCLLLTKIQPFLALSFLLSLLFP